MKRNFLGLLKSATSISRMNDVKKLAVFRKKILVKGWFLKWRRRLPELRRQNFWVREEEKKMILKFRKKKNRMKKRMVLGKLKGWKEKRKAERVRVKRKGQLRLQVRGWLKDFESTKLR